VTSPADEYATRTDARRATLTALDSREFRFSQLRLVVFGAGVLLAILAWRGALSSIWLLVPLIAFVILAVLHDRTLRARDMARRAVTFYERGLARIADQWAGTGQAGERFRDDHHPYAADLDLFGRASLFELLSVARTLSGEETLAGWLKQPATPDEVRERQDAVRELTGLLDLREALALAGSDAQASVHTAELVAWAGGPFRLGAPWHRYVAMAATSATLTGLAILAASEITLPLLAAVSVQAILRARQHKTIQTVLHGAQLPARDLAIVLDLIIRLERHSFQSNRLRELRARVTPAGTPASVIVRRLQRLVEAHDWQHNVFFAPVAAVLMWDTHLAWAIENWRQRHGARIAGWLAAVGEIEALSSLAAYRFEHPDDPFPDLIVSSTGLDAGRPDGPPPGLRPGADRQGRPDTALFEGEGLGHPLLPAAAMVRNDVRLSAGTQLLVVSGSNMSGKSTLLRTAGVNAVLAFAGGPVRARALRLSPLAVGATLRIQDSLQEGRSRFYAEITRIRTLVDLAQGPRPLLFLLDELFHGTNSHDRLVGASGVLGRLLDLGAIGLVTTHDLALTEIAERLGGRAHNVHFEDRFEQGEMVFDYRVKPGPVRHSNALALMRAVGLEVGE
jgi:hypothetical protein